MQAALAVIIVGGLALLGWYAGTFFFDGILTLIGALVGVVVGAIAAGKLFS